MWRRECKAVGLEGVTFHTMRHAWASWQVQAKTPLRILQELGGWATLEMPLRYATWIRAIWRNMPIARSSEEISAEKLAHPMIGSLTLPCNPLI
jgi:integrase